MMERILIKLSIDSAFNSLRGSRCRAPNTVGVRPGGLPVRLYLKLHQVLQPDDAFHDLMTNWQCVMPLRRGYDVDFLRRCAFGTSSFCSTVRTRTAVPDCSPFDSRLSPVKRNIQKHVPPGARTQEGSRTTEACEGQHLMCSGKGEKAPE